MSGVNFHLSQILQMLSLSISDDVLYITLGKSFLFKNWYLEAVSVLDDTKLMSKFIIDFVQDFGAAYRADIWLVRAKYRAFLEKCGLIPHDNSAFPVIWGLSSLLLAEVVRLLGIAEICSVALISPSGWSCVENA
ncbi:hypothetical protein G9A89_019492 [Geosiphon pyriformis]|nr:hypothetical protein G9A89_019492 [Geosiphon pyriformis]